MGEHGAAVLRLDPKVAGGGKLAYRMAEAPVEVDQRHLAALGHGGDEGLDQRVTVPVRLDSVPRARVIGATPPQSQSAPANRRLDHQRIAADQRRGLLGFPSAADTSVVGTTGIPAPASSTR